MDEPCESAENEAGAADEETKHEPRDDLLGSHEPEPKTEASRTLDELDNPSAKEPPLREPATWRKRDVCVTRGERKPEACERSDEERNHFFPVARHITTALRRSGA